MNTLATRLKELRLEHGFKLREVAERLNVSIRTISRYENGEREPSINMLFNLCQFYDVSADYLIGLTDSF